MPLTKVSNSMITGAPVSVFDYMTAAQITAVQTGVYGPVTPAEITAAIQASLDSYPVAATTTNMNWILPKGLYRINAAITFPTGKLYYPQLTFEGQIFQTSATADGLVFDEVYFGVITGVHVDTNWDAWANPRSAIKFNTLGNTILDINRASNFQKGLHLNAGPGATSYNTIYMSWMRNCKYGVYGTPDGSPTNFINANSFYGGSFENSYLSTTSGDVGIYIFGSNSGNGFYDQIFESIHSAFYLKESFGFLISKPYFETTSLAAYLPGCTNGVWIQGHQSFPLQSFVTDATTRNLTFINTGGAVLSDPVSIIGSSGTQLKSFVGGDEDQNPWNTFSYSPYFGQNCFVATDHTGAVQQFNKSYSTTTNAPPTVGNFAQGAMCWNATGTSGQPTGWICTALGTAGTLAGITASASLGSPTVTVNSTTGIRVGMYLNIAGGAFTGGQVLSITGTTLTMSTNSSATVVGQAVTYYAPTWKALANFA